MSELSWALVAFGSLALVWVLSVLALVLLGRRQAARDLARLVPDCLVLFRRLLADPRVPRRQKVVVGLSVAYLAMPFDLVPDFIPIAGQLDDALVVLGALRYLVRGAGAGLVGELWPGREETLEALLRAAGVPPS